MIKEIVKDIEFLSQKSEVVKFEEVAKLIRDLIDTAKDHINSCVGLAAPQIGELKRVIVVRNGNTFSPMINPAILKRTGNRFASKEGCLSLEGERVVMRSPQVMVSYLDSNGKRQTKNFNGLAAIVIQHEVDHLNGVLI